VSSDSGDVDGDSVSDSWSEIFDKEDKQTTPGRIGAMPGSAERRKRGRIELDFDEVEEAEEAEEEEEEDGGDGDSGTGSDYQPPRRSPRAQQTALPVDRRKKPRRLRFKRRNPSVLPRHALLSKGLLEQLSSASSSSPGPSAQEGEQLQGGSDCGAGSADAAPLDPNTGGWEYRTGRSPEGKDLRLLVFVPHMDTPGRARQHQGFEVQPAWESLEEPVQDREATGGGEPELSFFEEQHDEPLVEPELALQEEAGLKEAHVALKGADEASIIADEVGECERQNDPAQQELRVPNATLPSQWHSTITSSDAVSAAAVQEAEEDDEAYLTMEMDVTLDGEVSSHPGMDADASDLLHEEVRGYDSSDSQGRCWQDFGPDQEHDLVEFTADGTFPEVIPAPSGGHGGASAEQPIDLVTQENASANSRGTADASGSSRPRRLSAQRFQATLRSPEVKPALLPRNVELPSGGGAAPRSSRRSAGRNLLNEPVPSTLPASKKSSYQLLCAECKVLQNSNDEKELTRAISFIRASVVKRKLSLPVVLTMAV
jgi:hypothetical protein